MQDGFAGPLGDLPGSIRETAGEMLTSAYLVGILPDRKWAIEAAGILYEPDLCGLTRDSFRSPSRWLRDAAFRQVGRLLEPPHDIKLQVRVALLQMAFEGRLRRDRQTVRALLSRFPHSSKFLRAEKIAEWVPATDNAFLCVCAFLQLLRFDLAARTVILFIFLTLAAWASIRGWSANGFSGVVSNRVAHNHPEFWQKYSIGIPQQSCAGSCLASFVPGPGTFSERKGSSKP